MLLLLATQTMPSSEATNNDDEEGSAYNHRRRCSFKMSAKAASHLQIHLNGNFSRISSPSTHPAAAVHRQRPSPDRTKLRMTNTCEQTKHSIHGIQILFMWCQQTPLLDKHKLRSQALVDEFRQPPNIHNIGTYPPQNGHPGCDTTHRLTHKRPHLCQSSRSRTRQPTYQKKISSRSPLSG